MEPISAGVIVAALLAKALDRGEEGAVDAAVGVARRALDVLRRRLRGDSDGERTLEALVEAPDSARRERELAQLLEARAEHSPDLQEDLRAIIAEAEGAGIRFGSVSQVAEGEQIVQATANVNSQISVRQNSEQNRD